MPLHDWSRLSANTFHSFHGGWLTRLTDGLNEVLPPAYYALQEQHSGGIVPDVLTLSAGPGEPAGDPAWNGSGAADGHPRDSGPGGTAVLAAPPEVALRRELSLERTPARRRRTLTIRHNSGNRLVAMIELASPGNKDRADALDRFVDKVVAAIEAGIHVLVVDLYPPTPRDPDGLHGAIGRALGDEYVSDPARPLTFASYVADDPPVAYVQPLAVGDDVPDMPLFLDPGHYVNVPLAATYAENVRRLPAPLRRTLEGAG